MDDWQSGFVATNGIRLHYTRTGGDKPPLVLAHGLTEDGRCWPRVAEALAPDYDVVMLDARGHGRSDAPPDGYYYAHQAADLAGAIAALGLHRPVILGHSMGAGTALVLAGTFLDLPSAILLEDPGPWWMPLAETRELQEFSRSAAERSRERLGKPREELVAELRARYPGWQDVELDSLAEAKRRVSPFALRIFESETWAGVDWPGVLGRITCPVLLMTTDQETGGLLSPEAAAAFQTLVPHARMAHIPQASHGIRRDRFDCYLNVVREFLISPHLDRTPG